MKTHTKNLLLLSALIASLSLITVNRGSAQDITILHIFDYDNDGAFPLGGLILSGDTLYGTASDGGYWEAGTMFKLNTDGTGFTNVLNFGSENNSSNGVAPKSGLILSGDTLYGTASQLIFEFGGSVFAVNTNGGDFTALHVFNPGFSTHEGGDPEAELILSDNTLYGTTLFGGLGYGTVFAVNTNGTEFTNLHVFTATNGEGSFPGRLFLSGNTLFGATGSGGGSGNGTLFKVNTDGSGFTNLHSFGASSTNALGIYTNSDGTDPDTGFLSGNTLFGTTGSGGASGNGALFKINTDGLGFTNLHSFGANREGTRPGGRLALSGVMLYGTTAGTAFAVHTDGSDFTILHNFTASEGNPHGLILSGFNFYGTTMYGGVGYGTMFRLSLSPQLSILRSESNVVLSWPTNVAGFDYAGFALQSTTNLISPVIWTTNFSVPALVNGQYVVTNIIAGSQQFYRLSQ